MFSTISSAYQHTGLSNKAKPSLN